MSKRYEKELKAKDKQLRKGLMEALNWFLDEEDGVDKTKKDCISFMMESIEVFVSWNKSNQSDKDLENRDVIKEAVRGIR